mmetsp:Transcript_138504/g.442702  ORF Transcript_138504/g.442702 Transcript_138504/m.442702 type:complete len:209 (+) Transcript_138504:1271-1897(+)
MFTQAVAPLFCQQFGLVLHSASVFVASIDAALLKLVVAVAPMALVACRRACGVRAPGVVAGPKSCSSVIGSVLNLTLWSVANMYCAAAHVPPDTELMASKPPGKTPICSKARKTPKVALNEREPPPLMQRALRARLRGCGKSGVSAFTCTTCACKVDVDLLGCKLPPAIFKFASLCRQTRECCNNSVSSTVSSGRHVAAFSVTHCSFA